MKKTVLVVGFTTGLLACPPGTKTSIDAQVSVKVDPSGCQEDRTSSEAIDVSPDMSILDCAAVEGTGTIRVVFPRKEWIAILQRGAILDAGPGK